MTSSMILISINSLLGTGLSNATIPSPVIFELNNPSPPKAADDNVFRGSTCISAVSQQARNIPSSIISPSVHSAKSSNKIYRKLGSKITEPSPVYFGFIAVSPVTLLLTMLLKRLLTFWISAVTLISPSISCIRPFCVIIPVS